MPVLAPIAVYPIYQTRCQPAANNKQKRDAKNEWAIMYSHLHSTQEVEDTIAKIMQEAASG